MKESDFQFTDPSLTFIQFQENKEFSIEKGKEIEIRTNISVSNKKISATEAVVELQIILGEESGKSPFYLKTVFMARFKWVPDLDKDLVNIFLNQNAPALLLSYARPIISITTNASHFPSYNIPFINFIEE